MNRAEAKPDLGAFWKGKTRRTADAMLKKERGTFVSGGGGVGKGCLEGRGLTGGQRRQSRRLSRRGVRGRGGTFYLAMRE